VSDQSVDGDEVRVSPSPGEAGFLPAAHGLVLGMIASNTPLPTILDRINHLVEREVPESRSSVLLASSDHRLFPASAPSLPAGWLEVLADGVLIAPDEGSCGAAAWSRRPVIVSDVRAAPSWRRYAGMALAHGLQACWSVPILAGDHLLGTFAIYYGRPQHPKPGDLQRLAGYAQLAAVAVSRTRTEERMRVQLVHDPLTGLPGRRQLADIVSSALARLPDGGTSRVGVIAVRLGRLREINATFGHSAGDDVIRRAAAAMQGMLSGRATLLRVGGNRFAVVTEPLPDDASVLGLAHEVLAAADARDGVPDLHSDVDVAAVAGLAVSYSADDDPQQLVQQSNLAADDAAGGADQLVVFDELVVDRAAADLALELGLRRAVRRDELVVHYQPIIDLHSGEVTAVEALVRWQDPEDGLRSPGEFIPVAERTGLIRPITCAVLRDACGHAAAWRQLRPERPVSVSVNLSAAHLRHPDLVTDVRTALQESGIAPGMLWLEVTETAAMADPEASLETLRQLKSLGVRLAMDDFGTGYSSLAYLKHLPVDIIKMDGSFVREMPVSPQDTALVTAVVSMAGHLGLDVVGEGVETPAQRDALAAAGCHLAQGFLWSRPAPAGTAGLLAPAEPSSIARSERLDRPLSSLTEDALQVIVHELRNPLAIIQLSMDTITAGPHSPEHGRTAETVQRQVRVVDGVLQTLSTARALDRGSIGLDRRPLDLVQVVRAAVDDCVPLLSRTRIDVNAAGVVPVVADPRHVQQIVVNLLTNADKHSPPGGTITVTVDTVGAQARVQVTDEGPGIEPAQLGAVFRKFARTDHAQPGLGLGLYIARGLARAHTGELSAANSPSGGAELTLTLPRSVLPSD
jgi:diguanylate cyclase (GGDEF)-like protein